MVKFITRLLCSFRSSAAASHCGTGVSVFSTLCLVHTVPNLYLETAISFFCSVTYENVKIFYQNSITLTETHFYVKASSAIRQRALGIQRLKYLTEKKVKIILRHDISEDLSCK